ncbi:MAG: alpha/beta hydrolase [Acidobacteria bacterium]|nr:alpha/beta hydrolase [Acidobacteriota bacterium]
MAKQKHTTERAKVQDGGSSTPQLIDPMWILRTVGGLVGLALVCGYLTLCLLFWQGAWQLMLHPAKNSAILQMPGVPMEQISFAVDETGTPRLRGYWIPAANVDAKYAVLYLRGGDASLASDAGDAGNLRMLHDAGLHILAFDYRGYGQSALPHPSEKNMLQDAGWAYDFLTQQRGYAPDHVLLWGEGLGASIATQLTANRSTSFAALILDQPNATVVASVKADPRARILPAGLLLRDRFEISALPNINTPKLLMQTEPVDPSSQSRNDKAVAELYRNAASPKMTVSFAPGENLDAVRREQLRRFLDAWVPAARPMPPLPLPVR